LKFTVKLTEVLISLSPLGAIPAAQTEAAPAGEQQDQSGEFFFFFFFFFHQQKTNILHIINKIFPNCLPDSHLNLSDENNPKKCIQALLSQNCAVPKKRSFK